MNWKFLIFLLFSNFCFIFPFYGDCDTRNNTFDYCKICEKGYYLDLDENYWIDCEGNYNEEYCFPDIPNCNKVGKYVEGI